jgi:hypothetical protein
VADVLTSTPRPGRKGILAEAGVTGLPITGGFIWNEFLAKLQGQGGSRIYREMMDNDPVIGAMIFAIQMLVRGAEFTMQAVDDQSESVMWAERMNQGLFHDMEHTWAEFMSEVMSMLGFGYALHEVVWKICRGGDTDDPQGSIFDDGLLMPRKLAPRAQETIWRWLTNPVGDVIGAEQMDPTQGTSFLIPLERCLLFRTGSTKNNPEGRSVLRNSYISYLRKKVIEDAEGRAALRSAGVVVLEVPEAYFDPTEDEVIKAMMVTYRAMAKNLAADRQGAVLLPSTTDEHGNKAFDVRFVTAGTTQSMEMGSIIDRLDKRIAMTILADFIMLGQNKSGGGSYALSTDKTDLFGKAIETFVTMIVDTVNRKLLPRIWRVNQLPPEFMPKMKAGRIQVPDLASLGAFVQQIAGAGAPLFPNDEVTDALKRRAGLPVTSRAVAG